MTGVVPTAIDVISGRFGSSENVARQVRAFSSGHDTSRAVPEAVTETGPEVTPVPSNGMACARAACGYSTAPTKKAKMSVYIGAVYWRAHLTQGEDLWLAAGAFVRSSS